jgi:uncharacterized membrane protein YqaE (UPF0057 family)
MFVVRCFQLVLARNEMLTAQDIVNSLIRKAPTFIRYGFILQTVVGMLLCGLGYFMGSMHLRLILEGAKTQGTIVDYQQRTFRITRTNQSFTVAGYMPIVEYRAVGDKKSALKIGWGGLLRACSTNRFRCCMTLLIRPSQ